jgi:hypothetical protein
MRGSTSTSSSFSSGTQSRTMSRRASLRPRARQRLGVPSSHAPFNVGVRARMAWHDSLALGGILGKRLGADQVGSNELMG